VCIRHRRVEVRSTEEGSQFPEGVEPARGEVPSSRSASGVSRRGEGTHPCHAVARGPRVR
jgi:hypothetical protein